MRNECGHAWIVVAGFGLLLAGCGETPRQPPAASDARTAPPAVQAAPVPPGALLDAAMAGEASAVRTALASGVPADAVDENGRTALMLAAFDGHVPVLELLLQAGARMDLQDAAGRTALMYASSGPNAEAVNLLLSRGASVDLRDREEHFTALMFAAAEGQVDNVRLLLRAHADPMLADVDGDNARKFALDRGFTAVASLLEEAERAGGAPK